MRWQCKGEAQWRIQDQQKCKKNVASGGKKDLMRRKKRAVRVERERVRVLTQGRMEQGQRGNGGGRRAKEVYYRVEKGKK